jgi:hypothetical protein
VKISEDGYALDGRVMRVEVWGNWEGRLKKLEGKEGVVEEAARRGVETMWLVGGWKTWEMYVMKIHDELRIGK